MARYYDSGSDDKSDCLGAWLQRNMTPDIRSFRGQFGYYRYEARVAFEGSLRQAIQGGAVVHLTLGSNSGFLSLNDVKRTWDIVRGANDASLTIVSYSDVEFHPKTLHIARADGSVTSIVGSANFTPSGLGGNVEAFIELDTALGDAYTTIQQIADAIDRWRQSPRPSVFPVYSDADTEALASAGVINISQPPRVSRGLSVSRNPVQTTTGTVIRLARRGRIWRPAKPVSPPAVASSSSIALPLPASPSVSLMRWCKKLPSSDAQKTDAGTNPTGKLRLTQANFEIDQARYFRYILFGAASWKTVSRRGQNYDEAWIDFDVRVKGVSLGIYTLKVDHASHREAGQHNVTTTLAWGTEVGKTIRTSVNVGDWIIISTDASGAFILEVQSSRPDWAP